MGGQHDNGARERRRRRERAAWRLAARQQGLASRRQLLEIGITAREIEGRLEREEWRALRRGVYLLGPTRPPHAREMAAVLACGPRAVLSHVAAAHLWQLLPHPALPGPVDVTVAGRNPGQHPGIRVHRIGSLRHSEVTAKHGIPVTTPAHAIAEAFALRLTNRTTPVSTLDRHRGRPGVPVLRGQLEADHPPARTRSHPERHLLTLIRDAGLPHPEANARFGRWQVDLLWREQRVAVEIDGYAAHSSPWAFRRDYAKTADLENGGLRVIRVTWPQIRDQPQATLAMITRALEARYQSRP